MSYSNDDYDDTTTTTTTQSSDDSDDEELLDFCNKMFLHSSSSSSSDEEAEVERIGGTNADEYSQRIRDAAHFSTEMLAPDTRLTKYERDHLHCAPESYEQARRRILSESMGGYDALGTPYPTTQRPRLCEVPLTAEEKKKKVFTVRMRGTTLLFTIENYVNVVYFVNCLTGDLCKFSLVDLANRLIDYYVEYSCKKFAKVNMRYHDGLSFLLYTSSVLVETGSDNQLLSRRLLQHVVTLLREQCGYEHINIKRRKCQNIVATGKLSYNVCMHVLKDVFPAARDKKDFPGLVIKHRDLVKFFQQKDDGDGYETLRTENYVDDDDDTEVIAQINRVNDEKLMRRSTTTVTTTQRRPGTIVNEYGEEEDEEEAIRRITRLTEECAPRINGNETRLNGTFIQFREGQVISTGCKSDAELVSAIPLLKRLTYMCRESDAENRRREAMLVAQKKATTTTTAK